MIDLSNKFNISKESLIKNKSDIQLKIKENIAEKDIKYKEIEDD